MIKFLVGLLLWMVLEYELPNGGELEAISLFVFFGAQEAQTTHLFAFILFFKTLINPVR